MKCSNCKWTGDDKEITPPHDHYYAGRCSECDNPVFRKKSGITTRDNSRLQAIEQFLEAVAQQPCQCKVDDVHALKGTCVPCLARKYSLKHGR